MLLCFMNGDNRETYSSWPKKESETYMYARHPLPPVHINTHDPNTYDFMNYEKILKCIYYKR